MTHDTQANGSPKDDHQGSRVRPFEAFAEIDRRVEITEICGPGGYLRLPRCLIGWAGEKTQTAAAIHLLTASRVETKIGLTKIAATACLSSETIKRHLRWWREVDEGLQITGNQIGGRRVSRSMGPKLGKIFMGLSDVYDGRFAILPRWAAQIYTGSNCWSKRVCIALLLNRAITVAGMSDDGRGDAGPSGIGTNLHVLANQSGLDFRTARNVCRILELDGLVAFFGDDVAINPFWEFYPCKRDPPANVTPPRKRDPILLVDDHEKAVIFPDEKHNQEEFVEQKSSANVTPNVTPPAYKSSANVTPNVTPPANVTLSRKRDPLARKRDPIERANVTLKRANVTLKRANVTSNVTHLEVIRVTGNKLGSNKEGSNLESNAVAEADDDGLPSASPAAEEKKIEDDPADLQGEFKAALRREAEEESANQNRVHEPKTEIDPWIAAVRRNRGAITPF